MQIKDILLSAHYFFHIPQGAGECYDCLLGLLSFGCILLQRYRPKRAFALEKVREFCEIFLENNTYALCGK